MKACHEFARLSLLVLVLNSFPFHAGSASWQVNGSVVCDAPSPEYYPEIVSDMAGGAIITWWDYGGGQGDIHVQRVDADGNMLWAKNGVPVCLGGDGRYCPRLVSDGAGGAIITWEDLRNDGICHIYAQRVSASGTLCWTASGVAITGGADNQQRPRVASDGAGGAIITWMDCCCNVYVQRIDASGSLRWGLGTTGLAICTGAGCHYSPEIASDGTGGAIITWQDTRSGTGPSDQDIYVQRVNEYGFTLWTSGGVAVCTATDNQWWPEVISDGSGGAIITWEDMRHGTRDVYAQRVNGNGAVQWKTNGVEVCKASGDQYEPQLISDGAHGAFITWKDGRGAETDIYAQRIAANGNVLWKADGVSICSAAGGQYSPQLVSGNSGGAIITWEDARGALTGNSDIYAQRVGAGGDLLWAIDGVAVCTAGGNQLNPRITSSGASGTILVWEDYRNLAQDIYAQRVNLDGTTDLLITNFSASGSGGHVNLSWQIAVDVPVSSLSVERSELREGEYLTLHLPISKGPGFSFSCVDYSVRSGRTYWYRIVLAGPYGEESYGPIEVHVDTVPTAYAAYQSYPNPFNPLCTIRYDIAYAGRVSLTIFDVTGSPVRTLFQAWLEPGTCSSTWDGRDDNGTALPSGVYFYQLKAGGFVATRKMVLIH